MSNSWLRKSHGKYEIDAHIDRMPDAVAARHTIHVRCATIDALLFNRNVCARMKIVIVIGLRTMSYWMYDVRV